MTKNVKNSKSRETNSSSAEFEHIRKDPITGQLNYYAPYEILDDTTEKIAYEFGLEVSYTHLGNRSFWAVMLPCKDKVTINGAEVYVATPTEVQRERYLAFVNDELAKQDRDKHDGRCQISNGQGGVRRCPLREENPNYVPGSTARETRFKTRVKSCVGCPYEEFKYAHTTVPLSALDHEDDDGVVVPFEPASGPDISSGYCFEKWGKDFVEFVRKTNPKLAPEAELLMLEYKKSEIGRELGLPSSTVASRGDKLKELAREFMNTLARP